MHHTLRAKILYMTGYAVPGLDPVVADSKPLVVSSVWVLCARNSQREGRSLLQQGWDHLFQWGMGISAGFLTETTGSLRNAETRRTPSYV